MLRLIGVPVLRQGNIIDLGVRQMQIVDACSGLRYILALFALGVIFCYFYQRKTWKILVLMIVLIPATILANAIRVAAMGLYPALLEGFWHAFSGWLIFIFCFGILALVNYLLNRLSPPEVKEVSIADDKTTENIVACENKAALWKHIWAAVLIILIFIPITQRASYAPDYPLKEGFRKFSHDHRYLEGTPCIYRTGDGRGDAIHAHLNAEYSNPEHGMVSLWIVIL